MVNFPIPVSTQFTAFFSANTLEEVSKRLNMFPLESNPALAHLTRWIDYVHVDSSSKSFIQVVVMWHYVIGNTIESIG